MVPDRQKVRTDGMDGRTTPKLYLSDFVGDKNPVLIFCTFKADKAMIEFLIDHKDGSFEYPKFTFWLRNKTKVQLCTLIWMPD